MLNSLKVAVTALALSVAAAPVIAQTVDLRFVNRSGQNVVALQTSATSNPNWEDDLFQGRVLRPGQTFSLRINRLSDCYYDVRALLANGVWSTGTFDICSTTTINIR